jgi:hypothetical protein
MGVEYRHYLVVNDAAWMPEPDTAARVEKVLREWSLVDKLEKVIDLTNGQQKGVQKVPSTEAPGHGLALIFAGVEGAPVARIAGPSLYDSVSDADRYTMRIALVIGDDYRLHWSSESIFFKLVEAPRQDGKIIAAYRDDDPLDCLYAESFPSDENTSPPKVEIQVSEHAQNNVDWSDYVGFWRGALVIDFGKDLPAFIEGVHILPNREFVLAIDEAFGGDVIEVGEFC